jgi:DNA-binding transcriptional LysR family regulator
MNLGVALLPRRCAVTEIARGTLVTTTVPQLRLPRHLRLIYRQAGELSHAAQQFLMVARKHEQTEPPPADEPV